MQKILITEQINKLSKEDILKLSDEQFAGLILRIYLNEQKDSLSQYCRIKMEDPRNLLDSYNINNKFNTDHFPGITIEQHDIPKQLKTKLDYAIIFLKEHKFLRIGDGQNINSYWFTLTEEGKNIKINEDFTFVIERKPTELVNQFKKSVFHISGKNQNDDFVNGSCFLFNISDKFVIITAKHVLEGISKEGRIYLDEEKHVKINLNELKINSTPNLDVAFISSSNSTLINILKGYPLFKNYTTNYEQGENVIILGFPNIPGLKEISFNSSTNSISNLKAEDYFKHNKNIILNSSLLPGYSGAPAINMKGELIGIVSGNLTKSDSSSKINDTNGPAAIVPFNEFKDMLL